MGVHLYCLLPGAVGPAIPMGLAGVAGAPVRLLSLDDLVAWVSDAVRGLPFGADAVAEHDAVVDVALATGATPIPVRFGQRFDDEDGCRNVLAQRSPEIHTLLNEISGCVEMTLLVTPSTRRMLRDLEPVSPQPVRLDPWRHDAGDEYLRALRDERVGAHDIRAATAVLAERVTSAVGDFVRRAARHRTVTHMPLLTLSHLIPRDSVDAYRRAAESVPTGSELRLLVIGPRAPYSFSGLTAEGAHGMKLLA
jgi:Gas vesicle synthesis protein GvpL/GvpF